ncbi:MAG: UDP-glucose 4-epimerase GalE [Idiomarinaceae bacterium]|nr:UDP-glucose 4-epimerase GalE [Idiomarinaceae bacterium]|tara:strand:+ start:885 stop:1907 length:1023 start_codon:yes stop_codon:yes gene_type:complete
MNKSILLTGGTGYIGSHTTLELLNNGYEVVVIDNLSNSSRESLKRVEQLTQKSVTFAQVDVRDAEALNQVFENHNIQSVLHFAGHKAVGESVEKPIQYYQNNVAGTLTLCEVMARNNVFELIFSSSATVYGANAQSPISESMPIGATTNPYGTSKYMVERMLMDLAASDPRWRIATLRYFNPVGAHRSGQIGEDPNGIPNNLVPFVSQVAVGKLDQLKVFGNDYDTSDGTGVRDYIHVVDLALGHIAALRYMDSHQGFEAFNLGTGKGYSVLEVVDAFEQQSGLNIPYTVAQRRPGDIAKCFANPEKASKLLGWQAKCELAEMMRDTWHWQSQNPNGYDQ